MTYERLNAVFQWSGAVCFITMHLFNALGPNFYPYNIFCGAVGSVLFLCWSVLAKNKPQFVINVVGLAVCIVGIYKALPLQ
jgi:hypothetical protein